jgi:hypothetical protein
VKYAEKAVSQGKGDGIFLRGHKLHVVFSNTRGPTGRLRREMEMRQNKRSIAHGNNNNQCKENQLTNAICTVAVYAIIQMALASSQRNNNTGKVTKKYRGKKFF